MKKLVIIYNQSLSAVQGINYVNNTFVVGQNIFKERNIDLTHIYGADGVFDCHAHDCLFAKNMNSDVSTIRKKSLSFYIKRLAKSFLSLQLFITCFVRYYLTCHVTAKQAVMAYKNSKVEADYILFQDPQCVYYYKKYMPKGRTKCILILHCSDDPIEQGPGTFPGLFRYRLSVKKMRKLYDEAMDYVDKVVYLSKHAVEKSPLPLDRKTYIYNSVPDINNIVLKPKGDVINIVTVGSVIERKGQYLVIQALSMLDERIRNKIHYYVVGDGIHMNYCKELVTKYNLNNTVSFLGTRNDVANILSDMDVFILPSSAEGMPMSIIEAMRHGLYVVATKTGAIPEMIAPGCGELVDRDPMKIASCILRIVDDDIVSLDVKKNTRLHYLTDFTLKNMIYNYCDVLVTL